MRVLVNYTNGYPAIAKVYKEGDNFPPGVIDPLDLVKHYGLPIVSSCKIQEDRERLYVYLEKKIINYIGLYDYVLMVKKILSSPYANEEHRNTLRDKLIEICHEHSSCLILKQHIYLIIKEHFPSYVCTLPPLIPMPDDDSL